MKIARSAVVLMALSATVAACDDDPVDPGEVNLAGTYDVQTFLYEEDGGDSQIDLASIPPAQGGPLGIINMTVAADHSFSGRLALFNDQGERQEFDAGGQIDITSDNTMRIDFDDATDALGILDDFEDGTFTLSGDNLTLVLPDVTFDFTLQGAEPVPADLTIVASR